MDKQTGDCPCKRQRVSEGDEIDEETGMVLESFTGLARNQGDFQQGEPTGIKLGNKSEVQDESLDIHASGDNVRPSLTLGTAKGHRPGSNLSRNSYEHKGNQISSSVGFEIAKGNQSTESSTFEENENQSQTSLTGSQMDSKELELDSVCCASVSNTEAGNSRLDSGVCDYVRNVQVIAETEYIKVRERENYQKEYRRVQSLESPKLKRSLDKSSIEMVNDNSKTATKSQSKLELTSHSLHMLKVETPVSSESNALNQLDKESESFETIDRKLAKSVLPGDQIDEKLAECDQYKAVDRLASDIKVLSKNNASSEQFESEVRQSDEENSLDRLVIKDGSRENRNIEGNENSARFGHRSLDDSGFIEMFTNSVMGSIMTGCGSSGSYRNSGRTDIMKDSGNYSKNSNITCDNSLFRNEAAKTPSDGVLNKRRPETGDLETVNNDNLDENAKTTAAVSSELCKFEELGDIVRHIGQVDESQGAARLIRPESRAIVKDQGNLEHLSSHLSCKLGTSQVTIPEPVAGTSKLTGFPKSLYSLSNDSASSNIVTNFSKDSVNSFKDTSLSESDYVFGIGVKASEPNGNNSSTRDCSFVDGRYKLDYDQTQAIISQNNINSLPVTILVHILKNLTIFQLLQRASLVCKYWYNLCRDPDIWRSICLVNQHRLSDSDLERVLSFSDFRVRNVNLTDCRFVTNKGINSLVRHCTQIEVLKVMRCFDLTDVALEGISSLCLCRNLQALYMDGCCRITDKTVKEVSGACPELRTLHLNQCTRVSDQGIITMSRCCPHLVDLQLDHCSQVTDAGISELVIGCPNIRYLNLMCCGITDTGVKYLSKLLMLRNLDLSNIPRLTAASVVHLSRFCRHLQCINVSLNTVMDDGCISQLAMNLPALKRLYCVSCSVSDKGLEEVAKYRPTLEALDVGWCQEVTDHGVRVISLACKHLAYFGLIRCDKVTIETIEELVLKYPNINYSTFILESRRLLERARREGYQFGLSK